MNSVTQATLIFLAAAFLSTSALANEGAIVASSLRAALESTEGKAAFSRAMTDPKFVTTVGDLLALSDSSALLRNPEQLRSKLLAKLQSGAANRALTAKAERLLGKQTVKPATEVGGPLNFEGRDDRREASSVIQVQVDPTEAPAFRSPELWHLQNLLATLNQRLNEYRPMLDEESKLVPYWYLDPTAPQQAGLSAEHRGIVKRAIRSLLEQKADLESKIKAQKEADRPRLIDQARQALKDPARRTFAKESIRLSTIQSLPSDRVTAVLAGNAVQEPSPEHVQSIQKVVLELLARKKFILHDGDSKMAKHISEIAGPHSIAITRAAIPNMYMRLMAYEHAGSSVLSPESLVAQAFMMRGKGSVMLSSQPKLVNELGLWTKDLDQKNINLGTKVPRTPVEIDPIKAIAIKDAKGKPVFAKPSPKLSKKDAAIPAIDSRYNAIETLPYEALETLAAYSNEMAAGAEKLGSVAGAVIFGSAKLSSYNRLTYDTSRALAELGIAIATGGAGGAMRVANTAAWDAGAESVGIPIGGRNQLVSESTVFSEVQSLTFATSDYATRIPLLLHNRALVVLVPGGNGTLRELAAVLIQYAALDFKAPVLLVGTDYYQGLYDYLQMLPILKRYKERIWISNGPAVTQTLVQQGIDDGTIDRARLIQNPKPVPRTDATEFPENPKNPTPPWLKGWLKSDG